MLLPGFRKPISSKESSVDHATNTCINSVFPAKQIFFSTLSIESYFLPPLHMLPEIVNFVRKYILLSKVYTGEGGIK